MENTDKTGEVQSVSGATILVAPRRRFNTGVPDVWEVVIKKADGEEVTLEAPTAEEVSELMEPYLKAPVPAFQSTPTRERVTPNVRPIEEFNDDKT